MFVKVHIFSGKGRQFSAPVLGGCWVNVNETQVCKQTGSTHQFAFIVAFPCGNGELQQVNVQDTHVVWVIQSHGYISVGLVRSLKYEVCRQSLRYHKLIPLSFIFFHIHTSPQVHNVSVTFVREVESRIIQDESDQDTNKP